MLLGQALPSSINEFWAADFEERSSLTLSNVTYSVTGSDMMLVQGDYRVSHRNDGSRLGGGRSPTSGPRTAREWRLDRDFWNQAFVAYEASNADVDVRALAKRWSKAYNQPDRQALALPYVIDAHLTRT